MNQLIAEHIALWERPAARRQDGLQRLLTGWAALGITLSGATQLRIPAPAHRSVRADPGCLDLLRVFLLLRGVPFTLGRVFFGLVGYWLRSWVLLGLGAMVAIQTRKTQPEAGHDSVAFLYLTVLIASARTWPPRSGTGTIIGASRGCTFCSMPARQAC